MKLSLIFSLLSSVVARPSLYTSLNMKETKSSALKVQAGSGGMPCPGSGAMVHAYCEQTATFGVSCGVVSAEIQDRVKGQFGSWHDPHNNGTYSLTSASDSSLSLKRVTGDKKYTDKMTITLTSTSGGCKLDGCSESQVSSISDYSTNFCNVRMLYCGSKDGCRSAKTDLVSTVTNVSPSFGAGKSMSDCLKV